MTNSDFVLHWKEVGKKKFENFKANLIKLDGVQILDWRNENGSRNYYIRFLFDENAQSLTITGDLGTAVFEFTEPSTFDRISRYTSLDYFFEKMKTSTDKYYFVSDKETFLEEFEEYSGLSDLIDEENKEEIADLMEEIWELYGIDGIKLDQSTYDELAYYCNDFYEWIGNVGRRIHPRIILWFEALHEAREVLKNVS